MNLAAFLARRLQRNSQPQFRVLCATCLQPGLTCYCVHVRKFDPRLRFVILIHPLEFRRRIATGRMASLCLEQSRLLPGYNYAHNETVNAILADPSLYPVILYPGRGSTNLSELPATARAAVFPADKEPVIFVIDGTWATAKRMLKRSSCL